MGAEEASVLAVPVPEVDAVVGRTRQELDPSARAGMPAHVTILTPFVPKAQWSDVYATRLTAALAYTAPFEARFRRTGRFGRTTIYLVPEPERAFAGLIRAVATAFPEYPPYGGAFSEVLPHLTLAHGVPEAALDAVESTTYGRVDVRIEVSGLALFFLGPNGRWTEGSRVPLARQGLPGAGT